MESLGRVGEWFKGAGFKRAGFKGGRFNMEGLEATRYLGE
jgi:uncharacterized protein YodC (DUF2158 family)